MGERRQSTRKGIIAQELARRTVAAGRKGPCDIHTKLGGFELRWGPITKNAAGDAADRARAKRHGGRCVQIAGRISLANRIKGDISLYEFLKMHGIEQPAARANAIRKAAEELA